MTRIQLAFVAGAGILHVGMYVGMGMLPKEKHYDTVAIAMAETKKKEEKKKPPPPPPPPPPAVDKHSAPKAKVAPEPKENIAPAPEPKAGSGSGDGMDGFADLGISMGGGGGMGLPTGGGGGGGGGNTPAPKPTSTQKQVQKALTASDPGCNEDVVKPAMDKQVQPAYTLEAKQANVEGKVRLEITIDATGHVTNVKVIKGLGFGLDEAAVMAAKQYVFKPATKCGKPVPTTIKMGVNFGFK